MILAIIKGLSAFWIIYLCFGFSGYLHGHIQLSETKLMIYIGLMMTLLILFFGGAEVIINYYHFKH